jgi:hypothetical protein
MTARATAEVLLLFAVSTLFGMETCIQWSCREQTKTDVATILFNFVDYVATGNETKVVLNSVYSTSSSLAIAAKKECRLA